MRYDAFLYYEEPADRLIVIEDDDPSSIPHARVMTRESALAWLLANHLAIPPAAERLFQGIRPETKVPLKKEAEARHSPDFRSVHWYGSNYSFTANQAASLRVLWEAWKNETPDVGDKTILENADIVSERLDLVFRGHPAWGTMIRTGSTKGTHRLAIPK